VVPTTIHHDYVAHGFLAQANWSPNAPIAKSTQPEEQDRGDLFYSTTTIHGTKYRAELIAVMLALYILHKSESTLRSGNWKVTILCGLKSVVRDAFCNSPLGITQST